MSDPITTWLKHLEVNRRYSGHTLSAYRRDLQQLVTLADGKPLDQLVNGNIRHFLARLHGQGHSARSLARMLAAWRGFYKWWAPQVGMAANPAADVRAPKASRGLPKALSVDQTQALLEAPALTVQTDPASLRDRAMFELFYSSGLRLSELVGLDVNYTQSKDYTSSGWINLEEREVHVLGKGGKRRSVPIGKQAQECLARWIEARPQFAQPHASETDAAALFIGVRGARISPRVVQSQLTRLVKLAGLPTHVHPHVLRHSFASHVLQSAQDLRAVQEMLGHANISTTQLYTKLDFQHLAKAYDSAHPRAGRKS
ncbi:tyrosine recombinase XerC [Zwartia vadi]|uniref:tyrosine recombinase XerC n=1 Tax=Zwartia vadi TaxID=3058168 RepID=UPI0025B49394|nr:tyrosine recombinase XerC [Zwartia vadi]MDN3987459.1 tyrosine recombinase XerC [Zwartia vadi]